MILHENYNKKAKNEARYRVFYNNYTIFMFLNIKKYYFILILFIFINKWLIFKQLKK